MVVLHGRFPREKNSMLSPANEKTDQRGSQA